VRCLTSSDEFRREGREAWDDDLHRPGQELLVEPASPPRSTGVWIAACALIAAAAIAAYVAFFRSRGPERPIPSVPQAQTAPARALGGEAAAITVPPLDQSDGVVSDLVRKLSSHPAVVAWLTTKGLIRNFAAVVLRINDGKAPANLLQPLRPTGAFRVAERDGDTFVDVGGYDRYAPIAEAVASIDAKGAASLYATLKPRLEEAYRDLGQADVSFDQALERAIVSVLQTPVRSGPTRLRPQGIGYAFADARDEALTGAQKQLLRMGPKNARAIQSKLREIAIALGIPSDRLPR
jgi:hypothetical protein